MKNLLKTRNKRWLWLLLLAFTTGCASSTRITGTWRSPETQGTTYNRIIVAALTDNLVARQLLEANLQAQLQKRGVTATKSIDLFPPELMRSGTTTADVLLDRIKGDRHDAILTVALVDTDTDTRYVPGTTMYTPMSRYAWYGTFRGYYTYLQPTLYDPGYYREDKIYFLETNLYDAGSEKLLWSAQTQSYNPAGGKRFAEKFSDITIEKMQRENLIK